jgi:hypothetical protein
MVRPVCNVSSFANSGMRCSRDLAKRDRTAERNTVEDRDQAPDRKVACAVSIASRTSSAEAEETLRFGLSEIVRLRTCKAITCKAGLHLQDLLQQIWYR